MTQPKLAAPVVKFCSWPARNGGKVEDCGARIVKGDCSDRSRHMLPFVTGFCHSGWHEGDKINKPTCKFFMECPCKCHQDLWFMFELAERDRTLQDNSTYHPDRGSFVMPSREERIQERIASSLDGDDAPRAECNIACVYSMRHRRMESPDGKRCELDYAGCTEEATDRALMWKTADEANLRSCPHGNAFSVGPDEDYVPACRSCHVSYDGYRTPRYPLESPAPGIVPVAIAHRFDPTPTGRAARGELETWVREVTDIWVVEPTNNCTPQWISEQIARRKGLGKPPSVGAVDAVLKRWERIEFAEIGTKPNRFMGYTEIGVKFGLDFMKQKAKMK